MYLIFLLMYSDIMYIMYVFIHIQVGEEEQEYSDDEMELLARQARNKRDKQSKRGVGGGEGAGGEGNLSGNVPMGYVPREGEKMRQYKGMDKGVGNSLGHGLGNSSDKMKYTGSSNQATSYGGRGRMNGGTGVMNRTGHFDPIGNRNAQGPGLGQGLGPGQGPGFEPGPYMIYTHDSQPYGFGAPYVDMYPPIQPMNSSHPSFYPQDGFHQQSQHHHNYQQFPQQQFPPYPPIPSQPFYAEQRQPHQHQHQQHFPQGHHQHQPPYQQHYQHQQKHQPQQQQQHHDSHFSHSYSSGSATAQGPGLGLGPVMGSFKPPLPSTNAPLQFNFPTHIHPPQSQPQPQSQAQQQPQSQSQQPSSSSTTSTALPKYVYKPISFQLPKP